MPAIIGRIEPAEDVLCVLASKPRAAEEDICEARAELTFGGPVLPTPCKLSRRCGRADVAGTVACGLISRRPNPESPGRGPPAPLLAAAAAAAALIAAPTAAPIEELLVPPPLGVAPDAEGTGEGTDFGACSWDSVACCSALFVEDMRYCIAAFFAPGCRASDMNTELWKAALPGEPGSAPPLPAATAPEAAASAPLLLPPPNSEVPMLLIADPDGFPESVPMPSMPPSNTVPTWEAANCGADTTLRMS